nr:pyridoxal-phosphate dependent enzyme [Haladaptatus sp. R4]
MNSERTGDGPPAGDDPPTADDIVTVADVEAARERLDGVVHRTPLDRSTTFAERSRAASVGLKLENMQRTGSFKSRGAYNRMAQLPPAERERGVIASRCGQPRAGRRLRGRMLDIDTSIVVPEVTPSSKIEATRGYGADVVVEGDIYERSYEHALSLADVEELTFVHPFDDEAIIAGQGTVGLELLEQYPELDTVLVSIGGGGLISGIATVLKAHDPDIRVVGVQPEGAFHAKPVARTRRDSRTAGRGHRRGGNRRHALARKDLRRRPRARGRRGERHRPRDERRRHPARRAGENRGRSRGRSAARGAVLRRGRRGGRTRRSRRRQAVT